MIFVFQIHSKNTSKIKRIKAFGVTKINFNTFIMYWFISVIISEIILILEHLFGDDTVIVATNGTTVLGRKLYTLFEYKPYVAFWNIRYAEPPVGSLRFKVGALINDK